MDQRICTAVGGESVVGETTCRDCPDE
jgi:hypothetical protein